MVRRRTSGPVPRVRAPGMLSGAGPVHQRAIRSPARGRCRCWTRPGPQVPARRALLQSPPLWDITAARMGLDRTGRTGPRTGRRPAGPQRTVSARLTGAGMKSTPRRWPPTGPALRVAGRCRARGVPELVCRSRVKRKVTSLIDPGADQVRVPSGKGPLSAGSWAVRRDRQPQLDLNPVGVCQRHEARVAQSRTGEWATPNSSRWVIHEVSSARSATSKAM